MLSKEDLINRKVAIEGEMGRLQSQVQQFEMQLRQMMANLNVLQGQSAEVGFWLKSLYPDVDAVATLTPEQLQKTIEDGKLETTKNKKEN